MPYSTPPTPLLPVGCIISGTTLQSNMQIRVYRIFFFTTNDWIRSKIATKM